MQHIRWIDMVRGFSMVAILLFHTEIYYTGCERIPYSLYVGNVLVAFFFCSGFLFVSENKQFSLRHKLKSIVRSLLIPYFIFTLLIAFPKAFVHGQSTDIMDILVHIALGHASWFVAALIVSELIFSVLVHFLQRKEYLILTICIIFSLMAWYYGNKLLPQHLLFQQDHWCVNEALLVMPFLALGMMLRRRQFLIERLSSWYIVLTALLLFVVLKIYIIKTGTMQILWPMRITYWPVFIVDNILSTFLLIEAARRMENWPSPLFWTGSHSLVYYFFCGGIPLLTGLFLRRIGFAWHHQYWRVLVALLIVYALSSFTAWFFYRYFPFLLGKRKKIMP